MESDIDKHHCRHQARPRIRAAPGSVRCSLWRKRHFLNNHNGQSVLDFFHFFLCFFIQNYHLGFSVSMMKNCIQNKMWYTE
ncbi:hypothetical protein RUMGNA_03781 [Mediterraneibacter gnavus ATCC 29149]|uniref:Uncharacterized protein n=1 Tax=Mediterraneibacter gnavus (strain ATCC 29149 / DSM 114966 / JCM 6515 / VPI C7-9) TaxID=411470 RepID=A7B865_MEDG7|nr:hypothetical protein RUMGNA_03781 [Mediterraneibacter gnavus ATCC 29149]